MGLPDHTYGKAGENQNLNTMFKLSSLPRSDSTQKNRFNFVSVNVFSFQFTVWLEVGNDCVRGVCSFKWNLKRV